MSKSAMTIFIVLVTLSLGLFSGDLMAQGGQGTPTGAKALFFSGEGTTIARPGVAPTRQQTGARVSTPSNVKYMGLSYWIDRLSRNGEMKRVSSSTVFRQGDRIRVSLKSNREGYLYVINLGSTGSSTMLFPNARTPQGSNRIFPDQTYEIPPNGFFRFDQNPGEETLLVMLSPTPMDSGASPFGPPGQMNASALPLPPRSNLPASEEAQQFPAGGSLPPSPRLAGPSSEELAELPAGAAPLPPPRFDLPQAADLSAPQGTGYPQGGQPDPMASAQQQEAMPPQMMVSAYGMGSKGVPRGAKDLMIEDLTVKARTRAVGQKDLMLEEESGPNPVSYAVAPVSTLEQGGRLISLKIGLKHR